MRYREIVRNCIRLARQRPPYFDVMRVSSHCSAMVGGRAITRISTTVPMMFSICTRLKFVQQFVSDSTRRREHLGKKQSEERTSEGHAHSGRQGRQYHGDDDLTDQARPAHPQGSRHLEPAAVSRNFRDSDSFDADTRMLAGLGFVGRACIHPAQLAPARTVFVPSDDAVREAEQLSADLDRASSGVAVDSKGFLIVRPSPELLAGTESGQGGPRGILLHVHVGDDVVPKV